ncbi:tRNA (adenosine(37)-N6)-threonylcarbamoyltransferase complex dimerization subunit type 1 TsaB [Sagittula sp. NFXS13]|uniref:tRNA (adenosine(37)-N6)-threonylcarbamoyltransferase complex dimerization subunit type 1 TsaB n=1 Tax=Sagittula sp. NFXS13 TaxID=2819095 RepID=UPI0032DEDF13
MILAFDTSTAHVIAALLDGDSLRAVKAEPMARGQAERLMPLLEEVLTEGGATWQDVTRIGVGIGPGNFTGIRIAVSAARGLALGLGVPAVGVSTFDVIRSAEAGTARYAAIPAPRDMVYVQSQDGEIATMAAADLEDHALPPDPAHWAEHIARVAATKPTGTRPAPLYIRPADAAPSKEAPPIILDDA